MGILNQNIEKVKDLKHEARRILERENALVEGIIKEVYYNDIAHAKNITERVYRAAVCYLFCEVPIFSMRKESISKVTQSGNNPKIYCCYAYKYYEDSTGCYPVNISSLEDIIDLVDMKAIWRKLVTDNKLEDSYKDWWWSIKNDMKPLDFYNFIVELDIYGHRINLVSKKELAVKDVLILLPEHCQHKL